MIYSQKRNFIFIKTTKTAGSSVEIALSTFCANGDILTPLSEGDEEIRVALSGIGAQNYKWRSEEKPWDILRDIKNRPRRYRKLLKHPFKKTDPIINKFDEHMTSSDVKLILGNEVWENSFTFTVERNPWDKAVSAFYWQNRNNLKLQTLDEYIESRYKKHQHKISNWNFYTENNKLLVDKILRYECLDEDLKNLGEFLNLSGLKLPDYKAKGNFRENRLPAGKILSTKSIDLIGRMCQKEIEYFGYVVPS